MEKSLPSPEGNDIWVHISPKHQPQAMAEFPALKEKLTGGVWSRNNISGWETRGFSTRSYDFPDPVFSILKLEGWATSKAPLSSNME